MVLGNSLYRLRELGLYIHVLRWLSFHFHLVGCHLFSNFLLTKKAHCTQCGDAGDNTQCLSIAEDCFPGRLGIVRIAYSNAIPSLVLSIQLETLLWPGF